LRLFVAVTPPPAVLDELRRAVEPMRSAHAGLRWARPETWHVTLAFLGEVAEDRLEDLTTRLARAAARHPRPTLTLGPAGRFGGRVLWVRVGGDRERLRRLAGSVSAAARRAGIEQEERKFHAHLTLARSRSRDHVDLRPLVAALAGYSGTPWPAEEVQLIRSHLGAEARYSQVASWPLPPEPAAS
jgi:RNA 2',3'-cyclic 3'-phosphodiesterase